MPDLTLDEYKGYSEIELRRMLRAEARKINGSAIHVKNNLLWLVADHRDRRSGIELRQFSHIAHLPERRVDKDRRNNIE